MNTKKKIVLSEINAKTPNMEEVSLDADKKKNLKQMLRKKRRKKNLKQMSTFSRRRSFSCQSHEILKRKKKEKKLSFQIVHLKA